MIIVRTRAIIRSVRILIATLTATRIQAHTHPSRRRSNDNGGDDRQKEIPGGAPGPVEGRGGKGGGWGIGRIGNGEGVEWHDRYAVNYAMRRALSYGEGQ